MNTDITQRIRERAYQLWTMRPDSSDLDNWLAAEREITQAEVVAEPDAVVGDAPAAKKRRPPRRKAH